MVRGLQNYRWQQDRDRGHAITYTRGRLTELAALARYLEVTPTDLPTDRLVKLLELEEWGTSDVLWASDLQQGTVRDTWGNAILLQAEDSKENTLELISFGPNGRDDGGAGDDIVVAVALDEDKPQDGV